MTLRFWSVVLAVVLGASAPLQVWGAVGTRAHQNLISKSCLYFVNIPEVVRETVDRGALKYAFNRATQYRKNQVMVESGDEDRVRKALQPKLPRAKVIGTNYFQDYARTANLPYNIATSNNDIGLVPDFDLLRGDDFDPSLVDPKVRDFYEHTSAYDISVSGESNSSYAHFMLGFSKWVAGHIGNGGLPILSEAHEVDSQIAEWGYADELGPRPRVWARSYPLVGSYRLVRYNNNGYVTVLFPYPVGNQLSVLKPHNLPGGGLELSPLPDQDSFAGDFFSDTDPDGNILRTRRFRQIGQKIQVFVNPDDGQLETDHFFYEVNGKNGHQLHYVLRKNKLQVKFLH